MRSELKLELPSKAAERIQKPQNDCTLTCSAPGRGSVLIPVDFDSISRTRLYSDREELDAHVCMNSFLVGLWSLLTRKDSLSSLPA